MNKTAMKGLKFAFATYLVSMFLFTFVRMGTNIPPYPKTAPVLSDTQVALDQSHSIGATFNGGNAFLYFTTLSNIIAIVMIFIEGASFGKIKVPKKVKIAGLLYMIVTAIVFWTSIAPFLPGGHDGFGDIDNVEEHFIVLLGIFGFARDDKRVIKAKAKDYLGMLAYPILYLLMSTIIYFVTPANIAIYPFLDFYDWFALGLPQGASILITVAFIGLLLALFIFFYGALIKVGNKINAKRKTL